MDTALLYESPEFLKIYEILKRMDPLREVNKTLKWSKDQLTVRRLFSEMSKKLVGEEIPEGTLITDPDEPSEQAIHVTRRITKSELPTLVEEETGSEGTPQPEPSSPLSEVAVPSACEAPLTPPLTPTLAKPLVSRKIVRKESLHTRRMTRKSNYLWFPCVLVSLLLLVIVGVKILEEQPEPAEKIKQIAVSETPKNTSDNPSVPSVAPTPEETIPPTPVGTPEAPKAHQQNLTPLGMDLLVTGNMHRLLPVFGMSGKMLKKNCQNFLNKQDIKEYKAKHEQWMRLFEYRIKRQLAPLDGSYQNASNKEKAEKLHQLASNIEKTALAMMTYLEASQAPIAEKNFRELLVAARAHAYSILADELLNELSEKKYNLWLD